MKFKVKDGQSLTPYHFYFYFYFPFPGMDGSSLTFTPCHIGLFCPALQLAVKTMKMEEKALLYVTPKRKLMIISEKLYF